MPRLEYEGSPIGPQILTSRLAVLENARLVMKRRREFYTVKPQIIYITVPALPKVDLRPALERAAEIIKVAPQELQKSLDLFYQHQLSRGQGKLAEIKHCVSTLWKITEVELVSQRRCQRLVTPRHVAICLCGNLTPKSFPEIGRAFGDRDHTTCLSAKRKLQHIFDRVAVCLTPENSIMEWATAFKVEMENAQNN